MKAKLLRLLIVMSIVFVMMGATLPNVVEAQTPGQTWYINGDRSSGQPYSSLTTSPNSTVYNQDTYTWGMDYMMGTLTSTTFATGNWTVHFTVVSPLTKDFTVGVERMDATTNWSYPATSLGSTEVHVDSSSTGTTTVDATISIPGFTLTPALRHPDIWVSTGALVPARPLLFMEELLLIW